MFFFVGNTFPPCLDTTTNKLVIDLLFIFERNVKELYDRPQAGPSLLSTIVFHENSVTVLSAVLLDFGSWTYASDLGTAGTLLEDAYFSNRNDSFAQFWPGRVFEKLLPVEQATIGDDLRWICRFLESLLAFECRYFLSSNPSFLGVYRTHQNLCLELCMIQLNVCYNWVGSDFGVNEGNYYA